MKTRKQYLNRECSHEEFYSQFVTESIKEAVGARVGIDRIKQSKDHHLNDIPLIVWDRLTFIKGMIDRDLWRRAREHANPKTYPWSLSDQVCIAKQAAREIRKESVQ